MTVISIRCRVVYKSSHDMRISPNSTKFDLLLYNAPPSSEAV